MLGEVLLAVAQLWRTVATDKGKGYQRSHESRFNMEKLVNFSIINEEKIFSSMSGKQNN
uniref:Uncharacterized protein n=1 Tax=Romanomermis culicivorax TaxID=13658 RepID=A0A915K9R8_ROMCU